MRQKCGVELFTVEPLLRRGLFQGARLRGSSYPKATHGLKVYPDLPGLLVFRQRVLSKVHYEVNGGIRTFSRDLVVSVLHQCTDSAHASYIRHVKEHSYMVRP